MKKTIWDLIYRVQHIEERLQNGIKNQKKLEQPVMCSFDEYHQTIHWTDGLGNKGSYKL